MDPVVEIQAEPPARVESGLCSRFRCAQSKCAACAMVCPVPGAVRFVEQGAEITAACVACGACASACPNGAIRPAESDLQMAERIRNRIRLSAPFRIACEQADVTTQVALDDTDVGAGFIPARFAGAGGHKALPYTFTPLVMRSEPLRADFVLPCLSRLTEAILLEPIRGGAERVELLDPGCSGCRLQKAAPQWERVLNFSRALCESAGFDADRVVRVHASKRKPEEPPVPSKAPISRRALFRAFAGWTTKTVAAGIPDFESEQAPVERFRDIVRRHPENLKRSHLLDVLRGIPGAGAKSKVVPANGKPLAHLEITPQCVGCNVCEILCPVGALRHREENGAYALDFDPALCTGCRVCEVACFHKALGLRETVDLSVLFERRTATLIRAKRRTCPSCREAFLDNSSEFCPLCLAIEGRQKAIARRLIFGGGLP